MLGAKLFSLLKEQPVLLDRDASLQLLMQYVVEIGFFCVAWASLELDM